MAWDDRYRDWSTVRAAYLTQRFGAAWFAGRTIHDLGCGHGLVGDALAAHGATVRWFDGNPAHVGALVARGREATQWDFELEPVPVGADLLVCFGVLYHLTDPAEGVRRLCATGSVLAIESEVIDSGDPARTLVRDENGYDQSIHGTGVVPSTGLIEHALTVAGYAFARCDSPLLTSQQGRYDWESVSEGAYSQHQRRFWIAWGVGADVPFA